MPEKEQQEFLKEKDKIQIQKHFEALQNPVTLVFFTQETECQFCKETRTILTEVAQLSPKISLEINDFQKDAQKAQEYSIDKIPAIAVIRTEDGRHIDPGVRFYGIPSGYEFTPLILAILAVSQGTTRLKDTTKEKIKGITKDVSIQVFTTLTCPYCSQAVSTAHQLAVESDHITAAMVESVEFPHLAQKYHVMAVPKIVINETASFEGALPEDRFTDEVLKAVSDS
ncbi:MAG: thioredoxin family protein [Theionarchaea archaeon]|nr:thioredoxin family protein [Theionarchaea archaeon]MBU7036658.1 thioredoxin family protein [Theionarchaea archaeon]